MPNNGDCSNGKVNTFVDKQGGSTVETACAIVDDTDSAVGVSITAPIKGGEKVYGVNCSFVQHDPQESPMFNAFQLKGDNLTLTTKAQAKDMTLPPALATELRQSLDRALSDGVLSKREAETLGTLSRVISLSAADNYLDPTELKAIESLTASVKRTTSPER